MNTGFILLDLIEVRNAPISDAKTQDGQEYQKTTDRAKPGTKPGKEIEISTLSK